MSTEIITLDLYFQGVPETIASYLVLGADGPVLIETGPASTLETLKESIQRHGVGVNEIKHVLVSHIHLDHAGAAGWFAQQGAQIYVHHVGARHLIDPSRLLTSASQIYGDKMDMLWGQTVPAPAERVTAVNDNQQINAAGLTFTAHDTPGHAWHHHTYQLGNIAFTGDAAGIRLGKSNVVDVPAPPPEFKLEVWQQTIDRLMGLNLKTIYPTHFGRLDNVSGQLTAVKKLLHDCTQFVRERMEAQMPRDILIDEYLAWNKERMMQAGANEHEVHQYETANPLYMSVDGIMRYWRKKGVGR
ncbi:MAG: MBL fold metallo-hydrolase [Chloroflexi bacterium]|nr:MBL fold metallo-hydrolase [Chloroflexota bacterium]